MDEAVAHPVRLSDEDGLRDRVAELAGELRAAAMKGDTLRITRLLSDLLQFKRLTPERRMALEGLTHLIDSMRSLALSDELTGIFNRRAFNALGPSSCRIRPAASMARSRRASRPTRTERRGNF